LECLSAAVVIALIAWRPAMALFEPLDLWLVRFYGQISYSFYLLHLIGISLAFRLTDPAAWNATGFPLSLTVVFATAISILLTTPAAYLFWRFIEIPAIGLGKSFARKRAESPCVVAGGWSDAGGEDRLAETPAAARVNKIG
jgi:exopolysaccharide production protein ExoZ